MTRYLHIAPKCKFPGNAEDIFEKENEETLKEKLPIHTEIKKILYMLALEGKKMVISGGVLRP